MGLQGNLEDLPLLDIIQIVSFSKKTGYLSIEMEGGDGAIVFVEGLVVAAFTCGSPPADPRLATLPADARDSAVRDRIGFALEQLARLREGAFAFELSDAVPLAVGSRDIRIETLARGINPQELLLELAQGLDEDRAHSTAALEASFAAPEEAVVDDEPIVPAAAAAVDLPPSVRPPDPPRAPVAPASLPRPGPPPFEPRVPTAAVPPGAPGEARQPVASADGRPAVPPTAAVPVPTGDGSPVHTILLVDDEQDVREILGQHFTAAGYTVEEAEDPEQAVKAAGRLRDATRPYVLVTDLGMPATGGASFHGGFEVVKRLWKMNQRPPVLMMTEQPQPVAAAAREADGRQGLRLQADAQQAQRAPVRGRPLGLRREARARRAAAVVRGGGAAARGPRRPPAGAAAGPAADQRPPEPDDVDVSRPVEFLPPPARRAAARGRRERDRDARDEGGARVPRARRSCSWSRTTRPAGSAASGWRPGTRRSTCVARQVAIPLDQPSVFRDVVDSPQGPSPGRCPRTAGRAT